MKKGLFFIMAICFHLCFSNHNVKGEVEEEDLNLNAIQNYDCNEMYTISAFVDGGVPEYIFELFDISNHSLIARISEESGHVNFTGVPSGNYKLNVLDSKQQNDTIFLELKEVEKLKLVGTVVEPTCGGDAGAIYLDANGGSPPYSYSIGGSFQSSGVFTNVFAGQYTAQVKDVNNCIEELVLVVTEPAPLHIITTQTYVSCSGMNDGSISIEAIGGISPYEYSLLDASNNVLIDYQDSNTFAGLAAGEYSVLVRDNNGCFVLSRPIYILEPTLLYLESLEVNDITCHGNNDGSIIAEIHGGTPPYTYTLKDSNNNSIAGPQSQNIFNDLSEGTYEVFVEDSNSCSLSIQADILEPDRIEADIRVVKLSSDGATIIAHNVRGGTGPYEYSLDRKHWKSFPFFTVFSPGLYGLSIRDSNHCIASYKVFVSFSDISPYTDDVEIKTTLFPNPATENVRIMFNKDVKDLELDIYNYQGEKMNIEHLRSSNNEFSFNVNHLPKGTYLLKIQSSTISTTRKLVVE